MIKLPNVWINTFTTTLVNRLNSSYRVHFSSSLLHLRWKKNTGISPQRIDVHPKHMQLQMKTNQIIIASKEKA